LTPTAVPGVDCANCAVAVLLSTCTSSPATTPASEPLEVSTAAVLPSSTLSAASRSPTVSAFGKIEAVIPLGMVNW
jgi:hypothetical protein